MGTSTPGANGGKRPLKSKYWILSSPNKAYLDAAAELFGGVVEPWEHEKKKEWRLITQTTQLPVYVLPFAPQQALELYDEKRRVISLRCNGITCSRRNGAGKWETEACQCNPAENPNPECGARLTSRFNFIIHAIPTISTWMLETHGYNAAIEMPTNMQFAQVQGRLVSRALLCLEQRSKPSGIEGQADRVFFVPVLHIENLPHHLEGLTGHALGMGDQARALLQGEDPLALESSYEDRSEEPYEEFSEPYTEAEFRQVLSDYAINDPAAQALLVRVKPPSIMSLEGLMSRLSSMRGVRPNVRLGMVARMPNIRSWTELDQAIREDMDA